MFDTKLLFTLDLLRLEDVLEILKGLLTIRMFILKNSNFRLTNIYGIPSYEYPGLTKILLHGGPEADPDNRDFPSVEKELKYVSEYVKEHLPGPTSHIQKLMLQ